MHTYRSVCIYAGRQHGTAWLARRAAARLEGARERRQAPQRLRLHMLR